MLFDSCALGLGSGGSPIPPDLDIKIYAGDPVIGGITRAQDEISISAYDPQFQDFIAISYSDLKRVYALMKSCQSYDHKLFQSVVSQIKEDFVDLNVEAHKDLFKDRYGKESPSSSASSSRRSSFSSDIGNLDQLIEDEMKEIDLTIPGSVEVGEPSQPGTPKERTLNLVLKLDEHSLSISTSPKHQAPGGVVIPQNPNEEGYEFIGPREL